jgi:hypothetical protein
MTQADRVLSTPPTNTSNDKTRRRFLSQAAVAAAGGATLGMTLPLPISAEASDQARDPIFKAIQECTEKKKISDTRYAESKRAYLKGKEVLGAGCSFASLNTFMAAELGCDSDDYTDETASAWWESVEELFEIEPTTFAGVLALLRHADSLSAMDRELLEENAAPLISTLTAAIERIGVRA